MRFPFLVAASLFIVAAASGQQLGQTKEAIVARNGPATEENHTKNTAIYRKGPWKVDVTYEGNVAKALTFTNLDTLTESDIARILSENSDGGPWRELRMGTTTRHWQGRNFAMAQCDRVKPRSIRLTAGPFQFTQSNTTAVPISFGSTDVPRSTTRVGPNENLEHAKVTPPGNPFTGLFIMAGLVVGASKALQILGKRRSTRNRRTMAPSRPPKATSVRSSTFPAAKPPPLPEQVSPLLALTLDDISWENFELLAGEIFRRQGFEVEISSGLGADGGKDLTLRRAGEICLVQCKRLSAKNWVSVMEMREFYGLLIAENAKSGIFMTIGLYSRDAREFAEGKPIELLGRAEIEQLMASVAHPGENLCMIRNWIDDFAAVAHVTDPNCPRCRTPMKLRRGAMGRAFWGCGSFPRCHGKRDARTELVRAYSYQRS